MLGGARSRFLRVFFAVAALTVTAPAAAAGWEDVGTIDGVHVWRREEPGSSLMSFRGEVIAPVAIGKLVAVLEDPNQWPLWVDRYVASSVIERPSPLAMVYWMRFKAPAIVSDRDYVMRSDAEIDATNHVFTVNIRSIDDPRKGKDSCCVRATLNRTFHRLTALKAVNGVPRTKIEVEVNMDPKGLIPNWLANAIQKGWPSKTLTNLVRQAQASNVTPRADLATWHD